MSLIEISSHFKSSSRINESNFCPSQFLEHFIAHGTVLQTIDSLGAEFKGTRQRTFTITGPYGSGKSTLALFLSCLLSPEQVVREQALHILRPGSNEYARFVNNFPCDSGWLVIKHLCGSGSPIQGITQSVVDSLNDEQRDTGSLDEAACLTLLRDSLKKANARHDGVLIVIDELGKALDSLANNGGDLHFFQSLADLVQEFDNVIALGFLHQSFAAYAKGRDTRTQNEWGKVQGRYKDFGFNPSIEESMYLIGESFHVDQSLHHQLRKQAEATLITTNSFFPFANISALENILPLDPLVGLLLGPISKRSFSQNERSLFSFIATHERYGFRDFIRQELIKERPFQSLYRVDSLWDYLYNNIGHVIAASSDSKAWLEACDAVERATTYGNETHVFVTKLIALLSMMGRGNQLFASREFLVDYLTSLSDCNYNEDTVNEVLVFLEARSIVIYRHNLNSFHVFRASDLDINRLILDWIDRVKDGINWVPSCQSSTLILANAHYHRTGVMRWASTQVVNTSDQINIPTGKTGSEFVNFVLPTTKELYAQLCDAFKETPFITIAEPKRIDELERATIELIALEKITKEEAEKLNRDPIAKTEIESRIKLSELRISTLLESIFQETQWIHLGCTLSGSSLTIKVSHVADQIYNKCPSVQNELVNRMKLSGTANAALSKLMVAMLDDDTDANLSLPRDTFPPEKGIYLSCLKAKGWHTPTQQPTFAGNWVNVTDIQTLSVDERDMYVIWKAGSDLIKASKELITLQDLYDYWMKPPFGLTIGLSKLYAMALLKSLENHLAFYDFDSTKDWIYIPELDEELVAKFLRYPAEAGVRYYELADTDQQLVKDIALASTSSQQDSILATARSLVRQLHALPSWVKRTSGNNLFSLQGTAHIDATTKRFRDRVLAAKDPYKLILEDIPAIFGKDQSMSAGLKKALSELLSIDIDVTGQFKTTLLEFLGGEPGEILNRRCDTVTKSASRPDIENFAKRVKTWNKNQNQETLDDLISLLVGVRKESWTDERISRAYDKLRELCIAFKRYESFARVTHQTNGNTLPVSLIFQSAEGELIEREDFIYDSPSINKQTEQVRIAVASQLEQCSNPERIQLLVALLANEMKPATFEGK